MGDSILRGLRVLVLRLIGVGVPFLSGGGVGCNRLVCGSGGGVISCGVSAVGSGSSGLIVGGVIGRESICSVEAVGTSSPILGSKIVVVNGFSLSIGVYLRRNFLLRIVGRLLPCTLTSYCRNGNALTTTPVLSHLVGFGPCWF